jgi:hypothetical protein
MPYTRMSRSDLSGKKIVMFGAGRNITCQYNADPFMDYILQNTVCIIDNDVKKQGKKFLYGGYMISCVSFEEFTRRFLDDNTVVLISTAIRYHVNDIPEQIMSYKNNMIRWDFLTLLLADPEPYTLDFNHENSTPVIPKTIHYCWFGGKPLSPLMQKCLDSWSKFCPDYEVVRWNEKNYDLTQNDYLKKCYDLGLWALLSDYVRTDVVYQHGGVYLDTDVELIRNIDDLLFDDLYYGLEYGRVVNNGLGFGGIKGHTLLAEILDNYLCYNVKNSIGTENVILEMEINTNLMRKYGFKINNTMQLKDGIRLYPTDVFAPLISRTPQYCMHITENTHSIHYYHNKLEPSYFDKLEEIREKQPK